MCPPVVGYTAACNAQGTCEYAPTGDRSGWRAHDVWVYLPAGTRYWQGSPDHEPSRDSDEGPVREVTLAAGVLFGKHEVTVRQYEACEAAGFEGCTAPSVEDWDATPAWGVNRSPDRSAHPQNGLTWGQASAVCRWLGGRLPTESEWELAANGPGAHRRFPWGAGEPSDAHANLSGEGDGHRGTAPVGSFPAGASPFGALDLAGNVWEWVADRHHADYDGAPVDGTDWAGSGSGRVRRGGGFADGAGGARVANRWNLPGWRSANRGARCSRPIP